MKNLALITLTLLLTGSSTKTPRILIIGDSISIGYTPYVVKHFAGRAEVIHNPGNAGHTGMGLQNIHNWLGDEKWDIIQFNWGLWDLCYRHPDSQLYGNRDKVNGTITHSIEEYRANLDSIISILKQASNAKLVFVTTTYVPKKEGGRYRQDAKRYNRAAKNVMKKHNIPFNDIYRRSAAIHKKFGIGDDDVHFTDRGYQKLGREIADYLEEEAFP